MSFFIRCKLCVSCCTIHRGIRRANSSISKKLLPFPSHNSLAMIEKVTRPCQHAAQEINKRLPRSKTKRLKTMLAKDVSVSTQKRAGIMRKCPVLHRGLEAQVSLRGLVATPNERFHRWEDPFRRRRVACWAGQPTFRGCQRLPQGLGLGLGLSLRRPGWWLRHPA